MPVGKLGAAPSCSGERNKRNHIDEAHETNISMFHIFEWHSIHLCSNQVSIQRQLAISEHLIAYNDRTNSVAIYDYGIQLNQHSRQYTQSHTHTLYVRATNGINSIGNITQSPLTKLPNTN